MSKKGCLLITVVVVIIGIILLACCGIFMLFSTAFSSYDFTSSDDYDSEIVESGGADKIVVINVEGMIMDVENSSDLWGTTIASSQQISKYLDAAQSDDGVKAIILDMDTPGGDVYASVIIYEKIKEVQSKGIKVISLMRGTAASGGYYVAAPSDEIIAHQETITGSIGVRLDVQSVEGLYEKLGIETRTITNSEGLYKTGQGLFDDDPNGEEDQIYQRIVDETFDRFVNVVVEGRGMEKSKVIKIADGRVFTGLQAKDAGLVDEIGGFDKAVSSAKSIAGIDGDPTIIRYKEKDFWSSLMGYVSVLVNPTAQIAKYVDATPGVKLRYMYTPE